MSIRHWKNLRFRLWIYFNLLIRELNLCRHMMIRHSGEHFLSRVFLDKHTNIEVLLGQTYYLKSNIYSKAKLLLCDNLTEWRVDLNLSILIISYLKNLFFDNFLQMWHFCHLNSLISPEPFKDFMILRSKDWRSCDNVGAVFYQLLNVFSHIL